MYIIIRPVVKTRNTRNSNENGSFSIITLPENYTKCKSQLVMGSYKTVIPLHSCKPFVYL